MPRPRSVNINVDFVEHQGFRREPFSTTVYSIDVGRTRTESIEVEENDLRPDEIRITIEDSEGLSFITVPREKFKSYVQLLYHRFVSDLEVLPEDAVGYNES
jgi:hypothetical protein